MLGENDKTRRLKSLHYQIPSSIVDEMCSLKPKISVQRNLSKPSGMLPRVEQLEELNTDERIVVITSKPFTSRTERIEVYVDPGVPEGCPVDQRTVADDTAECTVHRVSGRSRLNLTDFVIREIGKAKILLNH